MKRPLVRRMALAVAALALAAGIAWGAPALAAHDEARSAWEQLRTSPSADARQSDALYARAQHAWRRAGWAGTALAFGLLLFAAAWRTPDEPSGFAQPPTSWRALAATGVDGALVLGLLSSIALDDAESAALHALTSGAPWLAFVPVAPLVWGQSPGLRATGLRTVGGSRGALAALLVPLALVLAPLGLVFPGLRAAHLRVVGLGVVGAGGGC